MMPNTRLLSWGAVWARPDVDGMLGIMRLVLACSPWTHRGMRDRYRDTFKQCQAFPTWSIEFLWTW
jgi:hypothetical protein